MKAFIDVCGSWNGDTGIANVALVDDIKTLKKSVTAMVNGKVGIFPVISALGVSIYTAQDSIG